MIGAILWVLLCELVHLVATVWWFKRKRANPEREVWQYTKLDFQIQTALGSFFTLIGAMVVYHNPWLPALFATAAAGCYAIYWVITKIYDRWVA